MGWLQDRVGGGSPWVPATGSQPSFARASSVAFLMALLLTAVSGAGLSFTYAPSASSAWATVYFTEHVLGGGWYVRSLHMVGAEASIVFGVIALVMAAIEGRYRGRRDLTFYCQALLIALMFVLCITGNPLRWDNRGYFGFVTEANIAGELPGGGLVRKLLLGGTQPGNWTLARLYALHVLALPLACVGLLGVWRRASMNAALETPLDGEARQVPRDLVASIVSIASIMLLAYVWRAPLEAPADPVASYNARPEWYFSALYVIRNAVPPKLQAPIAGGLPFVLGALIFALPRLDRDPERGLSRRAPVLLLLMLPVIAAIALTLVGHRKDARDAALIKSRVTQTKLDRRALQIAKVTGIPPAGGLVMLREDPILRSEDLFREHCASCHQLGDLGPSDGKLTAPTLDGWGTEAWAMSVLEDPDSPDRFGGSGYKGKMLSMTKPPTDPVLAKEWKPMKREDLVSIAKFLANEGAETPSPATEVGAKLIKQRCTSCHLFRGETDDNDGLGPELAGWGSTAWLKTQLANPGTNATYRPIAITKSIDAHMPRFDRKMSTADLDLLTKFVRQRARRATK